MIDNQIVKASTVLRSLLARSRACPVDIASAYFTVSGYRLLKEALTELGAFRLLLGKEPEAAPDLGLRPRADAALRAELAGLALDKATLALVEELIQFLKEEKVEVRLYDKGFLHAKAYLFHQDRVGPGNYADRMRPFAAIVGSSNFTGPGLEGNKELNLVHRVFTEEDPARDPDAEARAQYLRSENYRRQLAGEGLFDAKAAPADELPIIDLFDDKVSGTERRLIKSEVGARAVMELEQWFTRNWQDSVDFKSQLIDLLDKSKFGSYPYTPYQVYLKALWEYLRDQLDGNEQLLLGKTAIDLAEFQEDSVKRARRILQRYDGVLVADSVGLGKTWIGKRLLEDYAYHRRQKAVVICPASLKEMWKRELAQSTIAAQIVGMEELGRDTFDAAPYGDADVVLIDEAHNFRNDKSQRYVALDDLIQRRGGKGREGERKKLILLTATPINNDLFDLYNQVRLFTQNEQDYFREAGIGDLLSYFRAARRAAYSGGKPPGELLFNLLDEFVVRNTRPYIRAAYPKATIKGESVKFPERELKTITYSLNAVWGGLYQHVVDQIEALTLAPYALDTYLKPDIKKEKTEFELGREVGLVGIFKTRFLKRLESSVEAFRLSVTRAIGFEKVYLDMLNRGKVVGSAYFWKALRIAGIEAEDDLGSDTLADELWDDEHVRAYLESLPQVDLKQYEVDRLRGDVESDLRILRDLKSRIAPLAKQDAKLDELKSKLAGEMKGKKTLIFTSYRDTARYLEEALKDKAWLRAAGEPHVRRIDSANHPDERMGIVAAFAPEAMRGTATPSDEREIDVLISTDVLSEGQNLQDCGVMVNYDLTWNPIRLVQRAGRIDRLRSPHDVIQIWNMFPEKELEVLLKLLERLTKRISQIDDLGMLDASVLGETVHPRTFNALRRVKDGDVTVLDEEEARAELAGPEMLLKQLREMLNRHGGEAALDLPDGIHSGLRRQKRDGMFFYFRAKRPAGQHRHFWRYLDSASGKVIDNRFEIAQIIACQPDEPRFIGTQDAFAMQETVIESILKEETTARTKEVVSATSDPIQTAIAQDIKDGIRRGTVDRGLAKAAIQFLGQPIGRALIQKLRAVRTEWTTHRDDGRLVQQLTQLAADYGKHDDDRTAGTLDRASIELVCFDYVSPS
ncbi:MAG TPA: helicase-related protein [Tepidisphaeraceae bacterium]